MSPLIGQVLANNAVAMLTVGVGRRKRERQYEKKEESMKVVFIEREKQVERVTTQNLAQTTLIEE